MKGSRKLLTLIATASLFMALGTGVALANAPGPSGVSGAGMMGGYPGMMNTPTTPGADNISPYSASPVPKGYQWCWGEDGWYWGVPGAPTAPHTPPITGSNPLPTFRDMPAGCWYYDAVTGLSQRGVIGGYADGTFRADLSITRAQFAAMLGRMLGIEPGGTAAFADVRGHWAEGWIVALADRGIMAGRADGSFGPDDLITRQQASALVARALGLPNESPWDVPFPDLRGQWGCGYIMQLWHSGIVSGYGNGSFGPSDRITRAQAAAMLWRCQARGPSFIN